MKIESKEYKFKMPDKNSDIKAKVFSDIHYSEKTNDKKLDMILDNISEYKLDYLFFPGDLIYSNNFLNEYPEKRKRILKFLSDLGSKQNTFLSLGNHDFAKLTSTGWIEEWNLSFLSEISDIPGINLSKYVPYYEDDKIIVCSFDPCFSYYNNIYKKEYEGIFINSFEMYSKHFIKNMDKNKIKILLTHSPVHITDIYMLKMIKDFDFVICGHMHNGLIPPILDKLIKNNRGLISPSAGLIPDFPDNARGIKTLDFGGHKVHLIISGAITKFAESAGILSKFNNIYPMSIEKIEIDTSKKLIK